MLVCDSSLTRCYPPNARDARWWYENTPEFAAGSLEEMQSPIAGSTVLDTMKRWIHSTPAIDSACVKSHVVFPFIFSLSRSSSLVVAICFPLILDSFLAPLLAGTIAPL